MEEVQEVEKEEGVLTEEKSEELESEETVAVNDELEKADQPEMQDNSGENRKKISIRLVAEIVGGVILLIALCSAMASSTKNNQLQTEYKELEEQLAASNEENDKLKNENTSLTKEITRLATDNEKLQSINNELENGASKQLVDIKNAYEKGEWTNVINLTAALHEKYNGSAEDTEAQELARLSQNKIDEQKAAEEAEKAKGYETGITYSQLARTPDDFKGKKVKFSGKVVQIIEGDSTIQMRLAVGGDYDTILFGKYSSSIVSSRVLEDDYITIYGTSVGTISYQSTMGGTITIPGVSIEKIDQ